MIIRPTKFSSQTFYLDSAEKDIDVIDIALLENSEIPFINSISPSTQKEFLNLALRFQLPKGSYATMLFRELMKSSTSHDDQMKLNEEVKNSN